MKTPILKVLFSLTTLIILSFASKSNSTTWNVNVSNLVFTPDFLSVTVGDTIKWSWIQGNHTTTCDGTEYTSRPAGAASWNSNINNNLQTYKYVVTIAGTYNYKCTPHVPEMVASFIAAAPELNLNLTSIIEGFWNGTVMVSDTVKVYLHNPTTPFAKADSASVKLNTSGTGLLAFSHAATGSYYLSVTHRNALETWSKNPVALTTGGTVSYDFTTAANKAYGDNLVLKSGIYCIYSGDKDHDGSVNLNDVLEIYNDAGNFVTGYVISDLNGDNIVDLSDVLIAFNNSSYFVSVIKP